MFYIYLEFLKIKRKNKNILFYLQSLFRIISNNFSLKSEHDKNHAN